MKRLIGRWICGFALVLCGCNMQNARFEIFGKVSLSDGSPAVGAQGTLCGQPIFEGGVLENSADLPCVAIHTDEKGEYRAEFRYRIERFWGNSLIPEAIRATIRIPGYLNEPLENVKLAESSERGVYSFHYDFVNPLAYAWGQGVAFTEALQASRGLSNRARAHEDLQTYVDEYLEAMNPLEVMILVRELWEFERGRANPSRSEGDRILLSYSRIAKRRGLVGRKDLNRLAQFADSAAAKKIKQLAEGR